MNPDIVVVGSLNVDMVVSVTRRPEWGETILGKDFFTGNGGKGGNQAYAAGKLGASVTMVGKVGDDVFGEQLLSGLKEVGVDTAYIEKVPNESTGVAIINVNEKGENSIIVSPGANTHVTPEYVRKHEQVLKQAKLIMVQLEIPLDTISEVAIIAEKYGVPLMLDPAPAQKLPDELYKRVTFITPNESELRMITDAVVNDTESATLASRSLLEKGVNTVFSKLGSKGVVVNRLNQIFEVKPYNVTAIDTTAAGDAFAGGLATALVGGQDIESATQFANAVGALTVTKLGAQASMPTLQDVSEFMCREGKQ